MIVGWLVFRQQRMEKGMLKLQVLELWKNLDEHVLLSHESFVCINAI